MIVGDPCIAVRGMLQHFNIHMSTLPVNVCNGTAELKKLPDKGSLGYLLYIFCIGHRRSMDRSIEESSWQRLLDFS